jgi:ribosome recycling factor
VAEEDLQLVLDEAKTAMHKSLESLQRDLAMIRTGRANPVLIEGLIVDYYGTPTVLKALATIGAPEPRLLVIQPFDPGAGDEIERSILKADLGLTPNSDGKVIRIPIPELTEERRRDLVKAVKKIGEEHKVGVRSGRREAVSMLKDLEKSSDVTEDEARRGQKKVQDMTDEFSKHIDEVLASKEEEILTV